jgi:hypothetical protein
MEALGHDVHERLVDDLIFDGNQRVRAEHAQGFGRNSLHDGPGSYTPRRNRSPRALFNLFEELEDAVKARREPRVRKILRSMLKAMGLTQKARTPRPRKLYHWKRCRAR